MRIPTIVAATAALALAWGGALAAGLSASAVDGDITPTYSPTYYSDSETIEFGWVNGPDVTEIDSKTLTLNGSDYGAVNCDGEGDTWTCFMYAPDHSNFPVGTATFTLTYEANTGEVATSGNEATFSFTIVERDAWTIAMVTYPVYSDSIVHFEGTKPLDDNSADIVLDGTSVLDACAGVEIASSSWSCSYGTDEGFEPGSEHEVAVLDSEGVTVVSATFAVDPYGPEGDTSPLPDVSNHFLPGQVITQATPVAPSTEVRVEFYRFYPEDEDSYDWIKSCPDPEDETPTYLSGTNVCSLDDLTPGLWNVNAWQAGEYIIWDFYFSVPTKPTLLGAPSDSGGVTFFGEAEPNTIVKVVDEQGRQVCIEPSVTDDDGSWMCESTPIGVGSHTFRAYAQDNLLYVPCGNWGLCGDECGECDIYLSSYVTGGLSPFSAALGVTRGAPAALPETGGNTPTTPTTPTLITPTWFFSLGGIDLSNLHPGDKFTITGSGLPAGSKISAELHSTPVSLGTATVASNGTFSLNATVPENVEPGDHTVVVTLTGEGLAPTTKEQPVKVTAESETAGHSAEGSGTAEAAHGEAGTDAHGGAEGELSATAPNILTNSMNPIIEVLNDPGRIPAAFAAGLVLIIFAILPAHLLNSTIAEQYERFARRVPALRTAPKWYTSLSAAIAKAPALGGVLLMAATGFLFAFADPKFGFNLHSLRLIIALSAALFVVFFVANWITAAIMRRVWNVDVVVRLRPLGLILTVVGVIVSRILDFSPGFLVGVVLGLSIASTAAAEHAWKAVLIRASVVTTFGIGSWMVYSSIAEGVHHDPTFLNEVVLEFFVAIATEGIVLLLVELLPLHMLEGERLYKKSKVLWGAVYTVVLVVFILAVVPWEGNWRELGQSFWPWFTAVAIFGAVCVAIYLYFRFIAEPLHHDEHHGGSGPELEDDERIAVGNDS
jgi:hypothetical protein